MLLVALTGGIGSGKTTVGNMFANLGAEIVDSDQIAREIVERGSAGFNLVVAEFGDAILKHGELDRSALSTLVFNDPKSRARLESITHPLIRKRFAQLVAHLPQNSIVINQIPLLVESKGAYKFDHIITISASVDVRIERLKKRGMTATEIQKRIEAQASDSERELIADSVIINNESEDKLLIQVEHIWRTLVELNSNQK